MMKYILILSLFFSVAGFGQGQMFLRATPAAAGNLLLDDYPGAKAAFSVRKLDNDYVGNCLRVRRESDNAEQDIGFNGNDIDNAALTAFCAATNCRVVTWYDQSGNGLNATQATTTSQPFIVSSGVIENSNGITAVKYTNATTYNLKTSFTSVSQPVTYSAIAQLQGAFGFKFIFDGVTGAERHFIYNNGVGGNWILSKDGTGDSGVASNQNQHHFFGLVNSTTGNLYVDGSTVNTPIDTGTGTTSGITIGNAFDGSKVWSGYIQEIIMWDSNQSANRTAIETNTNNYYSIY